MARGEIAIVVGEDPEAAAGAAVRAGPRHLSGPAGAELLAAARAEVERLVAAGVARGDAARRVAAASGIPRRRLYGAVGDG